MQIKAVPPNVPPTKIGNALSEEELLRSPPPLFKRAIV